MRVAAGNAVALAVGDTRAGFLGRAMVGLGTGFAFVCGSDYIRARGGSAFLQGVYGGGPFAPGLPRGRALHHDGLRPP